MMEEPQKQVMDNGRNEGLGVEVGIATEDDWGNYRDIRQEAMEKEPLAFLATERKKWRMSKSTELDWKDEISGENSFVVMAKQGDAPVGVATATLSAQFENQWIIWGVYVNKDFRKQALNQKMLNLAFDELKIRGVEKVGLNVVETQKVAIESYEKAGFKIKEGEKGRFPPMLEEGVTWPGGFWMQKEL